MVRILLPSSEESPANLTQTTREEELEDAYERGAAEPILPLKLWRDRVIAVGSSAGSRAAWGLARRLPVRHHADGRPARAERRYPGARIILAHAGGFLPYASHRFAELARVFRPDALKPADILASFKRFYFDTALSSGPRLCRACRAFAGHGRILFGSDFPYAPVGVAASFTHGCRDPSRSNIDLPLPRLVCSDQNGTRAFGDFVNADSRKALSELMEVWKCRYANIEVAGHTDTVGKESDNLNLSELRAQAVRNYLVGGGVVQICLGAESMRSPSANGHPARH
jgi:hypothetical protein